MPLPAFPDRMVKWHVGHRLSAYSRGGGFRFRLCGPYGIPCSVPHPKGRLREHQASPMLHFAPAKARLIHDHSCAECACPQQSPALTGNGGPGSPVRAEARLSNARPNPTLCHIADPVRVATSVARGRSSAVMRENAANGGIGPGVTKGASRASACPGWRHCPCPTLTIQFPLALLCPAAHNRRTTLPL